MSTTIPQGWSDDTATFADSFSGKQQLVLHMTPGESLGIIDVTRETLANAVPGRANPTLSAIAAAQTDNLLGLACDPAEHMATLPSQLAGVAAVFGDLDCPPDNARIVITAHAGYAYYADFSTDPSMFSTYLPAFMQVLNSWSWS